MDHTSIFIKSADLKKKPKTFAQYIQVKPIPQGSK